MTELSRDRAMRDSDDRHRVRMAVRRRRIVDADGTPSPRTVLIESVLSLPGVSADPGTVSDVSSLVDTFLLSLSGRTVPESAG